MMDALSHAVSEALGLGVNPNDLAARQMALRALVVYVAGLAIVRLAKKRFMGRHSAFDGVLMVMLGSVLSRGVNGVAGLFGTLGAALVLIALHWIVGFGAFWSHTFGDLVKGSESEL